MNVPIAAIATVVMKYGDTLQQRSIPEWGAYNIDYNDIKRLIKERTRQDHDSHVPTAAISIPGQSSASGTLISLEDELFAELRGQHERIDLFVKSKLGEITRRLSHLHRQASQLSRQHKASAQNRITVRRLERYSRVESDVLKAGEELQSLDRFSSAQQQAFRKLLKKYEKWTGSRGLGERFRSEILNQESSFTNQDWTPLLDTYTDVLAEVRAPFEAGLTWRMSEPVKNYSSSTANGHHVDRIHEENAIISRDFQPQPPKTISLELHTVFENGSDIDADTALTALPIGSGGGRATYWVHSDNLVQMHILLLQYTRLWRSKDYLASCQSSTRPSRRGSARGSSNGTAFLVLDEIETIVCDDLSKFVQRQNTSTIANLEARSSSGQESTAASIRYSSTSEAIVTIGTEVPPNTASSVAGTLRRAKVKRKSLRQLFSSQNTSSASDSNSDRHQALPLASTEKPEGFERVRQWLQNHQEVQPLVQLTCRRTRFVGLSNGSKKGIWVTLDKNVSMKRTSLDDLGVSKLGGDAENDRNTSWFPHAVLEIRWEGRLGEDLVKALDKSYLAERVRGFTLETHAVATLYHPAGLSAPIWLDTLEKDIRKLPPKAPLSRKQSSVQTSPESASTRPTSISASDANGHADSGFSTVTRPESPATSVPVPAQLEAPPLKAFKKKRRSKSRRARRSSESHMNGNSRRAEGRYWNEFDDPEEPVDEVYTILIDPNESIPFPGKESIARIAETVKGRWFQAWHPKRVDPSYIEPEQQGLLPQQRPFPHRRESILSTSSSSSSLSTPSLRHADGYTTFSTPSHPRPHPHTTSAIRSRGVLLARCCAALFTASAVLLLCMGSLEYSMPDRIELGETHPAVLAGLAVSILLFVLALGLLGLRRRSDVSWVEMVVVAMLALVQGYWWFVLAIMALM